MTLSAALDEVVLPVDAASSGPAAPVAGRRSRPSVPPDVVALALALGVLLGPVVRGAGGRDQHLLALALASLVPAVLTGRVWQLGSRTVLLALGPGLAAVVVCATAPTGWAGAGDIARLLYAGLLFLAVRAIVTTPDRRALVLAVVSLGGLYEFSQAYLPWWGGSDVARPMTGSFYAPNVFAAYMAGAGLCAAVLAACGPTRSRVVGFVCAPFCLAAVAFSASRSTLALVLAGLLLGALLVGRRRAWRELARWGGVVLVSAALTALLGSSLLMEHSGFGATAAARKSDSSSETLASSGGYRVAWWKAAGHVGMEHPVTGAGFSSFGSAGARYQRADEERSVFVHDVLLQGWTDGGLVLALPLLAACLGLVLALLRRLMAAEAAAVAGALAGGLMLAHSLVDFDAQYPAALALLCVMGGVSAAAPRRSRGAAPQSASTALKAVSVLMIVVAALAALRADAADVRFRRGEVSGGVWTGASGPLRDARFDELRLRQGQHDAGLLARTAVLQQDSAAVTWDRAVALAAAGRKQEARALADHAWAERAAVQPAQVTQYARVLEALGDRPGAVAAVVAGFRLAVRRPTSGYEPLVLLRDIERMAGDEAARCLAPDLPVRLLKTTPVAPSDCSAVLARLAVEGTS